MNAIDSRSLARLLGGEINAGSVLAPGPNHSARDRSLSVKVDPSAPDGFLVHSFSGDDPLACKDYVREKLGIVRESKAASPPAAPKVTHKYVYQTADGAPFMRVLRYLPKDFRQQHWDGNCWVWKAPQGPKVPYRLPELLAAEHVTVFIAEGEKDADALASLGLLTTTNAGGAEKWTADLNEYFRDRDVYIIPHNDPAGERHAKQVFDNLSEIVHEVRIVRLPGLGPKGDAADWIAAGGTAEQLAKLMEAAPRADEAPAPAKLILSSADFLAGFIPPDYLIDGLIQRRFVYSLTAPTGSGKTAVALLLAASTALGRQIGEYRVERGPVLYLAGENPDDVRMRWLAMADVMKFDPAAIDVHFLPGVRKLSEIGGHIRAEVERIGPVALVVVDTSAAYFEGDDENGNVQMGLHARRMRSLVTLPGEPCVLVACHPVKNATSDNMQPRGGGAFIAEMDGNLTCSKNDALVTVHWQGKYRGPDFVPIPFQLISATTATLKDSKGRSIPTVVAKPLSEQERNEVEATSCSDEDALLIAIASNDRASMATLASALGWLLKDHKPNKARVQRSSDRLKKGGYVKVERSGLVLTEKGKKEVKRVKYNADAAGGSYG